ncbi:DNA-directed RNA polymerase subunit omega [Peptoniphilus olsenii]|uniref:DNA-directed RNA polymerase subunit omega n=1 Tax=Peptoniphilus olsenii TaxID=411570 RepID=A0ABV2J991_9FIRM
MIIPSFKEIREKTSSRYELVMLVSKRARKLVDNNPKLVETKNQKPVTVAIEEVMAGKIKFGKPMSDYKYNEKIKEERAFLIEKLKNESYSEINSQGDYEEE